MSWIASEQNAVFWSASSLDYTPAPSVDAWIASEQTAEYWSAASLGNANAGFAVAAITAAPVSVGQQFSFAYSDNSGAIAIVDFGGAGPLAIDSQSGGIALATAPELTSFGDRSLWYNRAITVTVRDSVGAESTFSLPGVSAAQLNAWAGVVQQVDADGIWSNDPVLPGDEVYAYALGDVVFFPDSGLFLNNGSFAIYSKVRRAGEAAWPASFTLDASDYSAALGSSRSVGLAPSVSVAGVAGVGVSRALGLRPSVSNALQAKVSRALSVGLKPVVVRQLNASVGRSSARGLRPLVGPVDVVLIGNFELRYA